MLVPRGHHKLAGFWTTLNKPPSLMMEQGNCLNEVYYEPCKSAGSAVRAQLSAFHLQLNWFLDSGSPLAKPRRVGGRACSQQPINIPFPGSVSQEG